MRILVIEDNHDAADALRELLEFEHHQAEVAHNGQDGLALARTLVPDVILCDIGLPGMDGYEVARAIRDDASLGTTCLVALSGYSQPDDVARALAAGFDHHLVKPLRLDLLTRLLAQL